MTQLTEQVRSILDRSADYREAEAYYEGNTREAFATAKLRNAFARVGYNVHLNFCRPVVDAVQNRLEISNVKAVSDAGQAVIDAVWEYNQLGLDANEVHRRALVGGDAYVLVWPDALGNVEISYHGADTTSIVYDPESPRTPLYAVRMWASGDSTRLNVYYADRIEKYRAQGTEPTESTNWTRIGTVENPYGRVPVFHFRTMRPYGRPEHKDAYDAQDFINKQFITSMWVSDFQGAPQRYALKRVGASSDLADYDDDAPERENTGALKNGPGEMWELEGYDAVGQFSPAEPSVFWDPIKDTVRSMASLTNTPLHYFEKTGNVPSGEALRVAEAPLIKKVNDRQISFGQSWREVFQFVLAIEGINEDVQVQWHAVESLDELERLDAALKKRNIGMSRAQVLREMGYDEEVIVRILEEADADIAAGHVYQRVPQTRVQTDNDERNIEENE